MGRASRDKKRRQWKHDALAMPDISHSNAMDRIREFRKSMLGIMPIDKESRNYTNPAYWGYQYALMKLHGPWPAAESIIASDAEWAFWYSRMVIIKNRVESKRGRQLPPHELK